ncbi:MAG: sigma-70 family RNA polymerase sigma factor, partial [Saprospiraceae bacterium]
MLLFFKKEKTDAAESDESLLVRYRQTGQSRYLGELFSRYAAMIYGVCLDLLGDPNAAEDAAMA